MVIASGIKFFCIKLVPVESDADTIANIGNIINTIDIIRKILFAHNSINSLLVIFFLYTNFSFNIVDSFFIYINFCHYSSTSLNCPDILILIIDNVLLL